MLTAITILTTNDPPDLDPGGCGFGCGCGQLKTPPTASTRVPLLSWQGDLEPTGGGFGIGITAASSILLLA